MLYFNLFLIVTMTATECVTLTVFRTELLEGYQLHVCFMKITIFFLKCIIKSDPQNFLPHLKNHGVVKPRAHRASKFEILIGFDEFSITSPTIASLHTPLTLPL